MTVPSMLSKFGINEIIAPVATKTGALWGQIANSKILMYPFVQGENCFEKRLNVSQWKSFGAVVHRIHSTLLPVEVTNQLRRETFAPIWRESVLHHLERLSHCLFEDPTALRLAAFMQQKSAAVADLISHAEHHAKHMQSQVTQHVVCHADMHAGNLLVDQNERLFIIDWDNVMLAPRERDLMFIGGGQGFSDDMSPLEEERLFYVGYGESDMDQTALAYYRYERIIEDIAVYCTALLNSRAVGEDRENSFRNLESNFKPNGTIAIAQAMEHQKCA